MTYDSTADTLAHIDRVRSLLRDVMARLDDRARVHDASKLEDPEKSAFDEFTPKLKATTYGSDEYWSFLAGIKPALDHHYAANSHHPEHYRWHCPICLMQIDDKGHEAAPQSPNESGVRYCPKCCGRGMIYVAELMLKPEFGIAGMSLLDLIEMFCDWEAARSRHADGDLGRSIKVNAERFNLDPQLVSILKNTKAELGW